MRIWLVRVVILVVVGMTFYPSVGEGVFIWDDNALVVHNKYIKDTRYLWRNIVGTLWEVSANEDRSYQLAHLYYRPLVTVSFMADHRVHGLAPWGFHLTNLLLHMAVVLLVFRLARKVLGEEDLLAPVVVMLAFATHPSRSEVAAWVSGRADSLMALFFCAALLMFWSALKAATSKRRIALTLLAWLTYAASVLSKEPAVMLPLVVLAVDWFLVNPGEPAVVRTNAKWCHLPLWVLTAGYVLLRLVLQQGAAPHQPIGLEYRLLLPIQTLGQFALMVVNPYQPNMQIGAEFTPMAPSWPLVATGLLVLVVVGLVFYLLRRNRAGLFSLLLAAACFLPVLNIQPLYLRVLAADRFLYLPFLGLALVLGVVVKGCQGKARRWFVLGVTTVFFGSWAVTASIRSRDFTDVERFWRAEVAANPNSPAAQERLAHVLASKRRYKEAEARYLQAFLVWSRVGRESAQPLGALVKLVDAQLMHTTDGNIVVLERLARFLEALLDTPNQPLDKKNHATLTLSDGVVTIHVNNRQMHTAVVEARADLHNLLGVVYSRQARDTLAIQQLTEAHRLAPKRILVMMNLAVAKIRGRDIAGATEMVRKVSRQASGHPGLGELRHLVRQAAGRIASLARLGPDPEKSDDARAHQILAELFILTKASHRACRHLRRVIALAPKRRSARAMLALELAVSGRVRDAQLVVEEAKRRFGDEPQLLELERRVRRLSTSSRSRGK